MGFRGYLSQAVASWFSRPAVGTAGAAERVCFFALAHGTQDTWLFGDRLAFGVVASWLAWRTGGLEAPVALHIVNNLVSLAFTAATGSLEDSLTASTLEWQFAVLDVAMMIAFAVVVDRWSIGGCAAPPRRALSGPRRGRLSWCAPAHPAASGGREPLGYGVIGSPADSGSASLGSSPGTPALHR